MFTTSTVFSGRTGSTAINFNDSVIGIKFYSYYGYHESLVNSIKRATNITLARKVVVIAGYSDVGKGVSRQLSLVIELVLIDLL